MRLARDWASIRGNYTGTPGRHYDVELSQLSNSYVRDEHEGNLAMP